MNLIRSRIELLREKMKQEHIDWYLITTDDYHSSEYVADFFKVREYYTGFTGDNAYLVLNNEKSYMWTDGRFFIQAERELKDTGIELMRMGEENVPSVSDFLIQNVKENETLAFDGRTVSTSLGLKLEKAFEGKNISIVFEKDIAGDLWTNRPSRPSSSIFMLSLEVSGESVEDKLIRVRKKMSDEKQGAFFLSSLDDIAWLLNIRANDVECNPVCLSYFLLTKKEAYVFLQTSQVTENVKTYFKDLGIQIVNYDTLFSFLSDFTFDDETTSCMISFASSSYSVYKTLKNRLMVSDFANPTTLMKAVKNETELKRLREIYVLDSVAVTKFMYWLKHSDVSKLSEISCAEYMDELRTKIQGYIELSFPTISGYGPNAAMMHYEATKESYSMCKPEGFLLVDSGGQYDKGTTDVTRTFALGPLTDSMKLHFTKVCAGMLNLADAKFLYGCTGRNVDILARLPLWELGIDYKCGTGHGVGYILNVHEGPHNIRWKYLDNAKEAVLEEGMIMSDEPGVYIENGYGIRTENVILCKKGVKNSDGQFMEFEHLTFVPIDLDAIDKKYLSEIEIARLNKYHKDVYEKISPYLTQEEKEWLKMATKAI